MNGKKSRENRFTLLKLPSTKVFTNEPSDSDAKDALQAFKNEYSIANGVEQQLATVNKLLSHFTSDNTWILDKEILCQLLTDLYFNAPLKHPLRSILAKALHKESTKKRDLIIESMKCTIIESNCFALESLRQNHLNTEPISVFVASMYGTFDNFAVAIVAIEHCFPLLLKSIHQFIDIFMKMLQNADLSPARRTEVFIDLHNTIRIVLSGVQQFQMQNIDFTLLDPILSQCWSELLDDPVYADAPIDTKINCAVLKVNYDRLFGNIFEPKQNIFSQIGLDNNTKMNFYAIAIVNTIVEKDLTDADFYPVLKVVLEQLIGTGKKFTIDGCLMMALTRALVLYTKKLLSLMRKVNVDTDTGKTCLRETVQECLGFVWINIHHSVDCVRYLSKDLLKNLLKLGLEQPKLFDGVVSETIDIAKSNCTNETLTCLLLDYLSQVFTTSFVLSEIPDIREKILSNLFNDSCWALCYEQLMSKNCEIDHEKWCLRWIQPLLRVDAVEWKNDFDRLKMIRNLFERALKTKPEAAEFILDDANISIEIYLFVLWIMRRSGRKIYAPDNYRVSADTKVIYAKVHPLDEIRILAFRILIECHKTSSQFPVEDLNEILEFFRYNCNGQNPSMRQQISTTMKRAMVRLECGYATAKRTPSEDSEKLCSTYQTFLHDLTKFCIDWCLFDGSNFGRRSTGLNTLLCAVQTWQKILPENECIYTEKLWIRLQKSLADSYEVNKEIASNILMLCWKFYPDKTKIIYSLDDLRKFMITFRPFDTMTAAQYIVFCSFSDTYFKNYYDAVIWCETILDDGLAVVKRSLLQLARYNALYGIILSIRSLLKRIDFSTITDPTEIRNWRSFFERIIPKCKEITEIAAPVVNSSAPEGHLPNDLNDVSHYLSTPNDEPPAGTSQIKVTSQIILICAWRAVREAALLLGEIALRIPVLSERNPNGFVSIDFLIKIGDHFQKLLVETKHRGAFEQSFLGFSNLCLRLWRSHEPQLHSYPMKLVKKIANIVSGDEIDAELDVNKLCITRRSAGVPFMVQGIVMTESQVCSSTTLTFCMKTFLNIAKTGSIPESRTHSLNILRALFRCAELGEAVSEYISDGIECSIRGYSAASWPERNSSTLLFSALMIRVFGVQRSKISENMSIKNKSTGRIFFIRYPRLYDFFYVELKCASEAIKRNERPPRLHPLLLLISRLYPSSREGSDSNFKLSTYIAFISTCSSSPELVTRQLSAKSIVALIPSVNVAERLFFILNEIDAKTSVNATHGYLLQVLYLLRSTKEENHDIDAQTLHEFITKFLQLIIPVNNIIGKTYLEVLLEILLTDRFHPIDAALMHQFFEVRNRFVKNFAQSDEYGRLTQSYVQKTFTIFNLLLSIVAENESPVITSKVVNTKNELVETQLNIMYLLYCQSDQKTIGTIDFSCYEIELVKFINRNHSNNTIILQLLPSICDLYNIIDLNREFYPFGVIKAYEILSMLITPIDAFEKNPELKPLAIGELIDIMNTANNEDAVDDVSEALWKFTYAHLKHYQINPSQITIEQMKEIVSHLRNSTQSYKSSGLRQTATEIFSLVIEYFVKCTDLELIISFSELLLFLLRDDDFAVRNRTSEIVMDMIEGNENNHSIDKVISLAAEDHLLQWLDTKFIEFAKKEAWSKWLDLLRLIYKPLAGNADENVDGDSNEDNLIDVDIFDDTEANTFDETIYTSYKCYNFVVKHINNAPLDSVKKQEILTEFATLQNI
ncbi:thyroid adenoma-associated protein homolog [Contarinia nasturtii]|uniref:thyroid adenoma-associated protein homolog n=1 Tax=Contarinia nasturtii TaxID=265458 RepID=UPI0012D3B906|nr:thyroid adenoma-associated protein homolog [Contarinia nasturtii]